jgi:hypothetical protein
MRRQLHLRRLSAKLSQRLRRFDSLNGTAMNRAHMRLKCRKGLRQDVDIPSLQAIHVDAKTAGKA